MHRHRISLLGTLILTSVLMSCSEIKTDDATDSYKYWAGHMPTEDIKVLNGKYWQSGHWTREYILYLKMKPTQKWWEEFIKHNQLRVDKEKGSRPAGSPEWFPEVDQMGVYKPADDFTDSRYFRDSLTGVCYLYEIQL